MFHWLVSAIVLANLHIANASSLISWDCAVEFERSWLAVQDSDIASATFLSLFRREFFEGEYGEKSRRKLNAMFAEKLGVPLPFHLTTVEFFSINHYTGSGYLRLNSYLRAQPERRDLELEAFATILEHALNKLPNHEGWVTRRTKLPANILERHQIGAKISYPEFLSTSLHPTGGYGESDHLIRIRSRTGRHIAMFSREGSEEVLFNRNSQFIVVGREEVRTENKIIITLEEEPPQNP